MTMRAHRARLAFGTWRSWGAAMVCIAATSSCAHTIANLGMASPAGVRLDNVEVLEHHPPVVGRSCATAILFVPLGRISVDRALADAVRDHPGAVLVDVRVREKYWTTLLWARGCFVVEGRVVGGAP
jgi:hypothetical protein